MPLPYLNHTTAYHRDQLAPSSLSQCLAKVVDPVPQPGALRPLLLGARPVPKLRLLLLRAKLLHRLRYPSNKAAACSPDSWELWLKAWLSAPAVPSLTGLSVPLLAP